MLRGGKGFWLKKALLAWAILLSLAPFALSQSSRFLQSWPSDRSPLEPDERIRWGSLDNGFRYAILPTDIEADVVSMRFVVNVGSLREDDRERGYAHLIEHIAFEGAGAMNAEDIGSLFQELGLSLGSDVNGFTTHHYTSYRLELKSGASVSLDRALDLYRGFADGIRFDPSSIEKQRAIVLAEKLRYDQPLAQFSEFAFGQTLKGTQYGERPIVGSEDSLEEATRERLVRFYEKWYRPELMTLFVVGDVDADALERQIGQRFRSLRSLGRAIPPEVGRPEENQNPRVALKPISGLSRTLIDLSRSWQEGRSRDTERVRESDYLRRFATQLLNERCQRFVGTFDSDFVFYDTRFETTYAHARLTTHPDKWRTGVNFLDRMIRQATRHGFHPDEIESLKERWRRKMNDSARLEESRVSSIADRIEAETMSGRVYLSNRDNERLELRFLESIDKLLLDRALRETWRTTGIALSIGGQLPSGLSSRNLGREFTSYRKLPVEPYDYTPPREIAWSGPPEEGEVVMDTPIERMIEASRIQFRNQTSLTFLNTDNDPGFAQVLVRVNPRGRSRAAATNPATRSVALDSFLWSGAKGYAWEDIHRELSTRIPEFSYAIEGDDCLCFRARCQPSEIEWFLQMIASYFSSGEVSERGFAFAKSNMIRGLQVERDGLSLAKRAVQRHLFPNQPQLWEPGLDEGIELQQSAVERWIGRHMEEGTIEVTVVGDAAKEAVVQSMLRSVGALEQRTPISDIASAEIGEYPNPGTSKVSYPKNEGDGALAISNWILSPGPSSFRDRVSLIFLERILRARIDEQLRQTMAVSYETKVDYWSLPAFSDIQRIRVQADCQPESIDVALEVIESVCRSMATDAPSQSDVEANRALLEREFERGGRSDRFILENILYSLDEHPEWVEEWSQIEAGFLSEIGPSDILEAGKRWLQWEKAIVSRVEPG